MADPKGAELSARRLAQHAAFPSELPELGGFDPLRVDRPRTVRAESDPGRRLYPGRNISGRFEIKALIASGGMGRVYLARQIALERSVAVKFLLPQQADAEFRRRFLLEASVSARLTHRHIVTVHDYGETEDGDVFIAMEYLDGVPLSKLISQELRLPGLRTCRISMQICRALRAAHTLGVVHRDLKPRNVMILRDDDEDDDEGGSDFVKVLDFGLVKAFDAGPGEGVDFTRVGTLLGSPKYMSPEQIRSQPVGPWTDVYALGAMMFHMLTGRPPFIGASSPEIMAHHVRSPAPTIQSVVGDGVAVAPELEIIVQRALAKRPDERYPTMDALLGELKEAYRLISGGSGQSGRFVIPDQLASDDPFFLALAPTVFPEAAPWLGPNPTLVSADVDGDPLRSVSAEAVGERLHGQAPDVAPVGRDDRRHAADGAEAAARGNAGSALRGTPGERWEASPRRPELPSTSGLSSSAHGASGLRRRPVVLELTWHFWLLAVLIVLTAVLAGLLLGRVRAPSADSSASMDRRPPVIAEASRGA